MSVDAPPKSGYSIQGQRPRRLARGCPAPAETSGTRRGVRPQSWRLSRTIIPSIALVTPARASATMAAPSLLARAKEVIESSSSTSGLGTSAKWRPTPNTSDNRGREARPYMAVERLHIRRGCRHGGFGEQPTRCQYKAARALFPLLLSAPYQSIWMSRADDVRPHRRDASASPT
jgi:hypothetical protein